MINARRRRSIIGNSITRVERNLLARQPNTIISPGSLAAMGSGVVAAIDGKLAAGARPTVVICGGGDLEIYGLEVMTAVSHNIPVIWIVPGNGSLGMARDVQTNLNRGRHVAPDLLAPDLASWRRPLVRPVPPRDAARERADSAASPRRRSRGDPHHSYRSG